jgi:endo-1,4-beta-xylanase
MKKILTRRSFVWFAALPLLGACAGEPGLDQEIDPAAENVGVAAAALSTRNAFNITIRASGLVLGVASGSVADAAPVVQWSPSYSVNDRLWYFVKNADGTLTIKNKNSGKCLDVNGASGADGASIIQYTCNGQSNQRWIATPASEGFSTLKSLHSGKCLDLSNNDVNGLGTPLQQYTCWGGTNQQFRLPNDDVQTRFVGNVGSSASIPSSFPTYWDQITPENAGKWGSVEATRNVMSWSTLDAIHQYAVSHNIPFKQHNFVWGQQQPAWLSSLSQAEQRAEVEQWIKLFCERYPDVAMIDVVNEPPPHTTPSYMAALGGAGASGYDWIIQSFKWARQYCPNATLILNDYHVLSDNTDNIVAIVNAVKDSGYIDAIGEQAHDLESYSSATLKVHLDKVLTTGLPLYITEYDVNLADDTQQLNVMKDQFTLFWNTPQIHGMTLWGYEYGKTWRPYTGLVKNGAPRPALTWLSSFISNK